MSITRATGERYNAPPPGKNELRAIADEFRRAFQRCHKHLIIFSLREGFGLSWSQIAAQVGLSRCHCSRVYYQTDRRIKALRDKKFSGVARYKVIRPDDDDQDDET